MRIACGILEIIKQALHMNLYRIVFISFNWGKIVRNKTAFTMKEHIVVDNIRGGQIRSDKKRFTLFISFGEIQKAKF